MALLIAALDVRGIPDSVKRDYIAEWMQRKIDILRLQETYFAPTSALDWPRNLRHRLFHCYGSNHSCGISVVGRLSTNIGRYLLAGYHSWEKCSSFVEYVSSATTASARPKFFSEAMTLMGSKSPMVSYLWELQLCY